MKTKKIREMGRNYTVGKPPMFTPVERLYRKIQAATIFQLKRWAHAWPLKCRRLASMHAAWVSLHAEAESPFLRSLVDWAAAVEAIRDEVAHRQTGTPRAFNPANALVERFTA